ncbi:peptide/nickel transport system substrate-binding protein [Labedaea rhizosphaerae]|uniref:Peptide/nickel transport system substrate-binding protein n=1 Tax=Labedaea rhizosphaerae TaxID=598644 RepID=A0A4R6SJX7_LABRH|nr:ABC transporter family substrate-binding protein [Labedaea rhizosphaerae]TDQ04151.1 peptide/nickel transport system substrate-binding protein [Labedaea rhizosphaerae]
MSIKRSTATPLAVLFVGAALVLQACGGSSDNGGGDAGTPTNGPGGVAAGEAKGEVNKSEYTAPKVPLSNDTFTVATDNPFTTYNNQTADGNNSYNTFALTQVLAGAYLLDGNNNVLLNKDVMDSVEVTNKAPFTVTWKIKPNVKWSDGAAWGCHDFYLDWLSQAGLAKNGGKPAFSAASTTGYELINKVECTDPNTVVTTFTDPYPDYKGLFGVSSDVLPAHIVEQQTGVADITKVKPTDSADIKKVADFWNTKWNGFDAKLMPASGPFKITGFEQNNSVTLERNDAFVGNKAGPAKIVLRGVSDQVAQAQALENGELDVTSSAQPDANAADRLRNLSSQGVVFGAKAGLSFEHLDLNYKNKLFQDPAVRKAFMQCVNREALVEKLIRPIQPDAKPLGSLLFFQGENGYVDNYAQYTGKADEAKATLTGAGWAPGGDGIMTKGGQKLSFKISHTDIPRRKQTVELIQSNCKAAGIDVKDDTDPNFLDTRVSAGDYDVALFAWSAAPFKSGTQAIYSTGAGQNWSAYSDPKVDQFFKDAVKSTDPAAANQLYAQADKQLAEDNYSLPLFNPPNMWSYKGIDSVYFQSYNGALWNANEWVKQG